MPPLSKWTAHPSRRETDEKPKGAILFPLYNKAFKLLADSDVHLFCLGAAAGWAGEERVIDEPAETSFRAKDGSEKAAVWVVKPAVYRRRVSRLSLAERWFTAPTNCLGFSVQKKKRSFCNRLHSTLCVCLCMHLYSGVCLCLCVCLTNWLRISGSIQAKLTSDLLNK